VQVLEGGVWFDHQATPNGWLGAIEGYFDLVRIIDWSRHKGS